MNNMGWGYMLVLEHRFNNTGRRRLIHYIMIPILTLT